VTEFTGERVIPGAVNPDLWAEHLARYSFAAQFSAGNRVLDAGCGTGYGCAELAPDAALVAGIDVASDAIGYARGHSALPNVRYAQASASAIPFAAGSFHLVTAFEVIEHLTDWRALLAEARRVLDSNGIFLVSTPNRLYYAESRALEGPNPYHVHEFEYQEFQTALQEFFPHVQILFQNRLESFAFHDDSVRPPVEVRVGASHHAPEEAHFFLGVCAIQTLPDLHTFLYVPRAANLLREREHHIRLLEQELRQSKQWLDQVIADHHKLQALHEDLTRHLQEQNRWASQLEQNWKEAQERVVQLQEEFSAAQAASATVVDAYNRKIADLEQENLEKTTWAVETETRLTAELASRAEHLAAAVRSLDAAETTVIQRTEWAQSLDRQLGQVRAQLEMIRQSRWVKFGRTFGIGPDVNPNAVNPE
jgi:ubiquinone/menaquinone biosynthesis C-methylase UbiE